MKNDEEKIASFFDEESKNMLDRHEKNGIPDSARRQVEAIISAKSKTAIDVGSGPGSLMIELLEGGVDEVIGVDLSAKMNEIAELRLEKRGFSERAQLLHGNFLNLDIPAQEAVSLHRVLCCHPNREGMITKSISLTPNTISITILRDWKFLKAIVWLIGSILDKMGKFRPYVHTQKKIDRQFEKNDYEITKREKNLFWTTTTYRKKNLNKTEN